MDRRAALKNIGVSFGSITLTTGVLSIIQSCQTNDLNWTPKFFTAKRIGFMDRMLEIIIPETDTPGAISLNLSKFIDAYTYKNISSKNSSIFSKLSSIGAVPSRMRSADEEDGSIYFLCISIINLIYLLQINCYFATACESYFPSTFIRNFKFNFFTWLIIFN